MDGQNRERATQAVEVEAYFATHKWPGTERGVQQAVESIRLNAEWLNRAD